MNVPSKSETEEFANLVKQFANGAKTVRQWVKRVRKGKKQSTSSLFPNVRFQN